MRLVWISSPQSPWRVLAVATAGGKSLVVQLNEADESDRDAEDMYDLLRDTVARNGPEQSKPLIPREGVYEFKNDSWRVPWFYDEGRPKQDRLIICTHAFRKQSQRTPESEKSKAMKRKSRYLNAKRRGELRIG